MITDNDAYQSEVYYQTVHHCALYRGWQAVYVGLGTMVFRNVKTGKEIRVDGPGQYSPGGDRWMQICWDEARRIIAGCKA